MKINTTALNQLKAFNDFANDFRANKDAVAKLDTANAGGAVKSIAQNLNDKSRAFSRTDENKRLNNATRDLFMATIAKLFGGEDNIPGDVLKAMHIKRFGGDGRPLTVRRIKEVNIAVIKSLSTRDAEGISDQNGNKLSADSVNAALNGTRTPANDKILNGLNNYQKKESIESLPDDIQAALSAIKETINTRCGAGTVKKLGDVVPFLGTVPMLRMRLEPLANGLVRDLNRGDLITVFNDILKKESVVEQAKLLERMEELSKNDVPGAKVNNQSANAMFETIPGLLGELKTCKTPDAYMRTLDKFQPQIKVRMETSALLHEFDTKAVNILFDVFEEKTGLDPKTLKPGIDTRSYESREVARLKDDIISGKVSVKTADQVNDALVKLAEKFVKSRQDLGEKIKAEFNMLPGWTLNHLSQSVLTIPKTKHILLGGAKYLKAIDLEPLKDAIAKKPFNCKEVSMKTYDFLRKILDITFELGKGSVNDFDEWGLDDMEPFGQLMVKAALAKEPELVKAIKEHAKEIEDSVHHYLESIPGDTIENIYAKKVTGINFAFGRAIPELYDAMTQNPK